MNHPEKYLDLQTTPEDLTLKDETPLEIFTGSPTPANSKEATVLLYNSPTENSPVIIKVNMPKKRNWGRTEFASFGDELRFQDGNTMFELKRFADSLEKLYDHLLDNEAGSNYIVKPKDGITRDIVEAIDDLKFTDGDSMKFMLNALRFSAMLSALRRRFDRDEIHIRKRTGPENRTGNLSRLPWSRYPEEYKTLHKQLLAEEEMFFDTHFEDTQAQLNQ